MTHGGNRRRASSQKRIQDRVADKAKHSNQPLGKFKRIRRGVFRVEAPVTPVHICWNHSLWFASPMILNMRVATEGLR